MPEIMQALAFDITLGSHMTTGVTAISSKLDVYKY
jgi:hypothetical protein